MATDETPQTPATRSGGNGTPGGKPRPARRAAEGTPSPSRRRALDILYEADVLDQEIAIVLARHLHDRRQDAAPPDAYTVELVQGVDRDRPTLDAAISGHSRHWTLERMPLVDRNILRLGAFELTARPGDPPIPVVISEAIELAKLLSTDDSGRFVHGVLNAIAKDAR